MEDEPTGGKGLAEHSVVPAKIAARLEATARQMAAYRDLPMGRHDPEVMASPQAKEAFEKFGTWEQELSTFLQKRIEQDRSMLDEMSRRSTSPGTRG